MNKREQRENEQKQKRGNDENAKRLAEESRENEESAKRLAEEEMRRRLEAEAELVS